MRYLKFQISLLALIGITACSDSTGPADLDTTSALHSLALGMESYASIGIGFPLPIDESFDEVAPSIDRVTVLVDGSRQTMYGLVLRESFPPGTCAQTIFGSPHTPDMCTPPQLGFTLVLWQSASSTAPPEVIMVLNNGDVGVDCFYECPGELGTVPAFVQFRWKNELWTSQSGRLTSNVTDTRTTPCSVSLPYYARSGNCNIEAFNVEGNIKFGNFVNSKTITLTITPQEIHGLWMDITEVIPAGP